MLCSFNFTLVPSIPDWDIVSDEPADRRLMGILDFLLRKINEGTNTLNFTSKCTKVMYESDRQLLGEKIAILEEEKSSHYLMQYLLLLSHMTQRQSKPQRFHEKLVLLVLLQINKHAVFDNL